MKFVLSSVNAIRAQEKLGRAGPLKTCSCPPLLWEPTIQSSAFFLMGAGTSTGVSRARYWSGNPDGLRDRQKAAPALALRDWEKSISKHFKEHVLPTSVTPNVTVPSNCAALAAKSETAIFHHDGAVGQFRGV